MEGPFSEKIKISSQQTIGWHVWKKTSSNNSNKNKKAAPGPLVVIFHGFLAHGRYPTVRYAAELCAAHLPDGATVVAADMPGHGDSCSSSSSEEGAAAEQERGSFGAYASVDGLVQGYGQAVLRMARERYPQAAGRQVFLLGSSMGGTIALHVALREPPGTIAGVVLLAPMLKLNVSSLERTLLAGLAFIVPSWPIIPSSATSSEKQYRDRAKLEECERDSRCIKSRYIRTASALTCVDLAQTVLDGKSFDATKLAHFPLWIGVADEDVVVDKRGSLDLHEAAVRQASADSTLKVYPALHGLLCEPPPLYDEITSDLLAWIKQRC